MNKRMLNPYYSLSLLMVLLLVVKNGYGNKVDAPVRFIIDNPAKSFSNNNFYYHDIALMGHPVHFSNDTTYIYISEPVFLLRADEFQTPYLIYPNEEIHIKVLETGDIYMYIPNNDKRTFELSFFVEMVKKTDNLSYAFKVAPFARSVKSLADLKHYEEYIFKTKKYRIELLLKYLNKHLISNTFFEVAGNSINSVAFGDSLRLYAINSKYLKNAGVLAKKINEKKITISSIKLMHFRYSLEAINELLSLAVKSSSSGLKEITREYLSKFINENFYGDYKDYLLFKVVFDDLVKHTKIEDAEIKAFYKTCTVMDYAEMIKSKLKGNKNILNTGKDAVINVLFEGKDLSKILSEFKDKLVLVDIWASWCSPCREEFKYSKQLKEKLEGKSIEFLYLSIDDNQNAWISAHKKEGLIDHNSYLLLQPDHTSILKSNEVISIPRYILIGRDGKIVDNNAPRPSDAKLFNLIIQYL